LTALGASVGPDSLTERERKIVGMLVECMSNDQIASALFVTRDTVKYHLKNIYPKLGVRSRLEAIRVLNRGA
jgi:LuxR family maltose regulon positive regulatory protein